MTTNQRQSMIGTKTTAILKTSDLVERWRWVLIYFGPSLILELKARIDASDYGGEIGITKEMLETVIFEIEFLHKCIIDPDFYSELQLNQCSIGCIIPFCPNAAIYHWGECIVENPEISSNIFADAGDKVNRLNYRAVKSLFYYVNTHVLEKQRQTLAHNENLRSI